MTLMQMTVSGGIFVLAVALLRLCGGRLPRRMFTALWAVAILRLMIPFALSSPTSVYNVPALSAADTAGTFLPRPVAGPVIVPGALPVPTMPNEIPTGLQPEMAAVSPWLLVWLVGAALLAGYFLVTHLRCRRVYAQALPMENPTALTWLEGHPLKRHIWLKRSDHIAAPLTYGLLCPVILLPASMEAAGADALDYVLAHEWTHIRRWDTLYKLCLCAALCLHWFNPAVWLLAFLAERDLELSCDEAVVGCLETQCRSGYAMALLGLEERRGGLMPLGSHFSKSAIEARIKAILKYHKAPAALVAAAVLLAVGLTAVFATSAQRQSYAQVQYGPLMELRFDGYKNLTVGEYRRQVQEQIGKTIDEETYLKLFDGILGDETLLQTAMTDADAFFLMNTLRLTVMDNWRDWYLDGSGVRNSIELGLEVDYWLRDPEGITVGQRDAALRGMVDDAWAFLERKTTEELEGQYTMNTALSKELVRLEGVWETKALDINTQGGYSYLGDAEAQAERQREKEQEQQEIVESRGTPGSREDYDRILTLMAGEQRSLSVEEFSNRIFRAGDDPAFFEATERVAADMAWNDIQVSLTLAEQKLLYDTWRDAISENTAITRSEFSGELVYPRRDEEWFIFRSEPPENPRWDVSPFEAQAYFYYWWKIPNLTQVSVGERDERIQAVKTEVRAWLAEQSDDTLATEDTQAAFETVFARICAAHSDDKMTLEADQCGLSVSDNRRLMEERAIAVSERREKQAKAILREFGMDAAEYTCVIGLALENYLPEREAHDIQEIAAWDKLDRYNEAVYFLSEDRGTVLAVRQDSNLLCYLFTVVLEEDWGWKLRDEQHIQMESRIKG